MKPSKTLSSCALSLVGLRLVIQLALMLAHDIYRQRGSSSPLDLIELWEDHGFVSRLAEMELTERHGQPTQNRGAPSLKFDSIYAEPGSVVRFDRCGTWNRELAQKPHKPHAAFWHCAKPHTEIRPEVTEKPSQWRGSWVETQVLWSEKIALLPQLLCAGREKCAKSEWSRSDGWTKCFPSSRIDQIVLEVLGLTYTVLRPFIEVRELLVLPLPAGDSPVDFLEETVLGWIVFAKGDGWLRGKFLTLLDRCDPNLKILLGLETLNLSALCKRLRTEDHLFFHNSDIHPKYLPHARLPDPLINVIRVWEEQMSSIELYYNALLRDSGRDSDDEDPTSDFTEDFDKDSDEDSNDEVYEEGGQE
ncbi:hypothetical protein DFH09DRAFT_1069545 [Mycena vulgaris]|nr:hypothetical protein DFH09DRAFT_1069545 [Mycena vulgaris]